MSRREIIMYYALLLYFTLFLAAAFVWPTWRLWRRDGVNGLVLARDDSAHGVVSRWFKGLIMAIFALLISLAAGTGPALFAPVGWLQRETIWLAGWVLLIASLILIVAAQAHMAQSWRIGFDASAQPQLISSGLFARSRNPIFLGMRINMLGLFLALPNAVTLAIALLGEALIAVQVRLEEEYLGAALGNDYAAYCKTVPRWM
jgi:protein-S-isoprenylcysteine O-methyltransferase Ste14